ncbi:lipopolysaccharide/colanic/teichoic acid biosynthesis glycosyltransferase [Paenibacillus cellulosilyticus]|uniref:Lipopolysaccharide/colanic/teichoic acid biosynthesis glycosyltransferase n=1 Tax=Paenibacillus cellulosilyticus TaxID=375489 RepID=A0A2V2YZH0_9BACL|nr:lipopolysaccharide/colanic/teichoic acid biosynthesis glycosyltransferase [Paenibacillus cellulosilyticus]QKS44310.1 sugar transferase [Paenibacillus cellulosilyticus]
MSRIAHICTSGISHHIMGDKLRLLQQEGWDVTFITSAEGTSPSVRAAYPFRWEHIAMERSIKPLADLASIIAMYRLFRKERFDVVHTHTAKAGLIGRVAAKLARVPVVMHTSHGLPFYEGQSKPAYWLYRTLEKVAALFCDALASQNGADAEALRKLAPWRPVYTEGNGVDLDRLDDAAARVDEERLAHLQEAYGLAAEKPLLFVAARFEPVKDHGLLLDALKLVKREGKLNWTTVLAGQGPLEGQVRERLQADGLTEDVVIVGQQPSIVPWLAMADAVALTSEKEGIPRSIMEAMALGKPVVATNVPGTKELVVHGETGLLAEYRNADKLAEALAEVMLSESKRSQFGAAGRARIASAFTESIVVQRLLRMYRETARRTQRARGLRNRLRAAAKRAFDLAVSVPAFVALLPVYGIVALLVRLKLGSPVLFRQKRPGRHGMPFMMHKFRTMTDATDASGQPLPDEVRLTAFGRLLRKLSLDELPQLLNVIRGEMSLVGPRPLLMEYLALYTEEQGRRHDVRPGITGWAQVNGRNELSWDEKFKLDVDYVDRQSFGLDLRILAMTAAKVWKREGIAQPGKATMSRFTGEREAGGVPW